MISNSEDGKYTQGRINTQIILNEYIPTLRYVVCD